MSWRRQDVASLYPLHGAAGELTEAGGTDSPLLPAANHTKAGGVVRPWLYTGFGGRLGRGGPRGALGWGPTCLPGAAGLGRGCCFGTKAPRSRCGRRAWGDSSHGSVSDNPDGLPCGRSGLRNRAPGQRPRRAPLPTRAHTGPVQEAQNQCPEPPAPDQHTWASCVTYMVHGHFTRVQAASSGVKTALFSIL